MTDDAEALTRTLANWRDSAFADLIVVAVGLAAQQRPEELRKALAAVFDLKAVEDMNRRVAAATFHAEQQVQEARHLIAELHKEFDRLETRMSGLDNWLEGMARKARELARTCK